ncbi:MAG: hypothetical protein WBA63_11770 [Thermomicrobiales bacterium]
MGSRFLRRLLDWLAANFPAVGPVPEPVRVPVRTETPQRRQR